MMPSVVKANPTVTKEGSAAAVSVGKTSLDVPRKRSQLLVSKGSSHSVKSGECSGVTLSKSNLANSRSLKVADGSQRQKVDSMMHGAVGVASAGMGHTVTTRNPTVRTTRVKSSSSECAKSGINNTAEKSNAVKTTSASGAMARVNNAARTTMHRKSVVETDNREEISSTCVDERKSVTVATSLSGGVKHEVSVNRCSRVPASSHTKTTSRTLPSSAARNPRLKQANGMSSVTSRTSGRRDKASAAAVKLAKEKCDKPDRGNKSVGSRSSSSSRISKVSELISDVTVDGSNVTSDQVTVSQQPLPAVNVSSLCNASEVKELLKDANGASDHQSHVIFGSPHCESVQSGMDPREDVSESTDVVASVTCVDENGSDLEETTVCDISLNSCLSDCSTSLFHSACSSVIGSVSDMKPSLLDGSMENAHQLAVLSASNSVSMESLHSSAGYCTPSEADSLCEVADCTLLNTDDSRYVYSVILMVVFEL